MRELVVLTHHPGAGPSAFVEVLDARSSLVRWREVEVPAGAPLPHDLDALAGVLVLGGSMSAVDPSAHPWMPAEVDLLRAAVDAEVPVLGVCLGAQLLGAALGGTVKPRQRPQAGFLPVTRTEAGRQDPVAGGWPDGAAPLFLHEDEVAALPPDAVPLLAGGDGTPGWRVGSAVAVQFHPEVTAPQLADWVTLDALVPVLAAAGTTPEALTAEMDRRERLTVPWGRALVGRWVDGEVRRAAER